MNRATKLPVLLAFSFAFVFLAPLRAQEKPADVRVLIPWLLKEDQSLKGIPFSDVIAATSGKKIIPFDAKDADDQRILKNIGTVMDEVLRRMNAPDSAVKRTARINEASSRFENLMQKLLDAVPDFSCDFPRTKSGRILRSGYPDLRLVDKATGRICYLDPKLYAKGSRGSSFRTFYFEPKNETNKVNDDAHHLIVGIEHDKTAEGWRFLRWELIDISQFRVRLKAEFEGSNRDMYRPEAVVGAGP
jgi:hypothetical protein